MSSDPPPEKKKKRPHPLEAPPEPRRVELDDSGKPKQQVILHIPVVKPTVTQALAAINSIIFFVAFYVFDAWQHNDLYSWGANNRYQVLNLGEYHRLITAMFLHGNLVHI